MNIEKTVVKFYKGNSLVRSEMFSSAMEAEMYISNEVITFDSYIIETGPIQDVV